MIDLLRFSPIVERELRVAARRPVTYWARLGAALTGAAAVGWLLTMEPLLSRAGASGLVPFRTIAIVSSLVLLSHVTRFSSATFAKEKREDTLGLLFLTPLRPIDLVLGKLVSACLGGFYRFLALVPMIALPMLSGGISVGNFAQFLVGLFALVLLTATLGLYLSARSWEEQRATTSTTVYFLALVIVVPCFAFVGADWLGFPGAETALALSPAYAVMQSLFNGTGRWLPASLSLLWTALLVALLLRGLMRLLPGCWQQKATPQLLGESVSTRPVPAPVSQFDDPAAARQTRVLPPASLLSPVLDRSALLDQNPIAWLAGRSWVPSGRAWVIAAVGLAGCVSLIVSNEPSVLASPAMALFVIFCVNAAIKSQVIAQASAAFSTPRVENPLNLLIDTPLTAETLIEGHVLALGRLRRFILGTLAVETVWLLLTFLLALPLNLDRSRTLLLPAAAVLLVFLPDVYAAAWRGLWHGTVRRNPAEASSNTFRDVLVMPWLLTFVISISFLFRWRNGELLVLLYVLSSLGLDYWFVRRAQRDLPRRVRLAAQRRLEGVDLVGEEWRHWGRRLGRWWGQRQQVRKSRRTRSHL